MLQTNCFIVRELMKNKKEDIKINTVHRNTAQDKWRKWFLLALMPWIHRRHWRRAAFPPA